MKTSSDETCQKVSDFLHVVEVTGMWTVTDHLRQQRHRLIGRNVSEHTSWETDKIQLSGVHRQRSRTSRVPSLRSDVGVRTHESAKKVETVHGSRVAVESVLQHLSFAATHIGRSLCASEKSRDRRQCCGTSADLHSKSARWLVQCGVAAAGECRVP